MQATNICPTPPPLLRFITFGIYGHILDTDRLWEVELSLWLNEKTLFPRSFHVCVKFIKAGETLEAK